MAKALRDLYADLQLAMGQAKPGKSSGSSEALVMKVAELMFTHAIEVGASDIHIEPSSAGARVRFRIDGMLQELLQLAVEVRDPLIRSIKVKANMANETVARSKPQDGRINFQANGRHVDLRLSSFPTLYGDVLAIRLLDRAATLLELGDIGMPQAMLQQFGKLVQRPNGLFLVTGPGNSGKTTTLYGALNQLRSPHLKVVTLEDPIEYQVDGINQAQVNTETGITFAAGLRAILRQDANVILLGEIRDAETAEISIRAALTGHLVLSTLHTRHSFGAVLRLMDMGIEPHLIVGSINGVIAQRLVRILCRKCRTENPEAVPLFERLWKKETGQDAPATGSAAKFYKGAGCAACNHSGYKGRTGIFELLAPNEEVRRCILERDVRQMYKAALATGMTTMMIDGLAKAAQGLTSIEEVLRVTGETSDQL